MTQNPQLVVVGSIGLDTIRTPAEHREDVLGGSLTYACAAASRFVRTGMVGVVGTDFPESGRKLFRKLGIDARGLQTSVGRTFRWSGVYARNMNNRKTLKTELNVFESFQPRLPPAYRRAPFVFLANIAPALQLHVLDQMTRRPEFVMADTMDLWIRIANADLRKLVARVDLLTVNESEAHHFTGHRNLIRAARALREMGPKHVLVKCGEHGSLLFFGDEILIMPAYPLEEVVDPTGAGDSFAGGLMGHLAAGGRVTSSAIARSMLYGSVVASFNVEAFSLEKLGGLSIEAIEARATRFRRMCRIR
ncbi:MAG: bifunctional hydroxymethylpyrimidine kinase/phosphomethylpyrimidine kinase [Verrucomicrobia bacterium]|nr:bifunctional hydroxymethylpyrimidine kinase/phosphomethylpyrimidine kinase [Verrucomicrobiota bacterium]